jgi:hypothetical protein
MSSLEATNIIRTQKDEFRTPNIYSVLNGNVVEIMCENFRAVKQDRELFLFFEHEGRLYFPIWFEFRSINNNLLFLFEEFKITTFSLLEKILNSSLKKEEHMTAEMKAVVYHTVQKPPFAIELKNFHIEENYKVDLYEKN